MGTTRPGPLYLLDGDAVRAAPTETTPVVVVRAMHGDLWFTTDRGPALRLRAGALKAFPRKNAMVHEALNLGGSVWLRAEDGAYRVRGERARRLPDQPHTVWTIEAKDGCVLVLTQDEAYRIDGDEAVQVPRESQDAAPSTIPTPD